MILIKTIYVITKSLEWIEKKKKSDSNTLRTFQLKSAQVYIPKTMIDPTLCGAKYQQKGGYMFAQPPNQSFLSRFLTGLTILKRKVILQCY